MFHAPWFAWAGLALAAGPLIIHLLNRQRYKVVSWAAMDFLRHAVRRSRRIMRLQDILLLALRTLVVLLFGLAMARPYFQSGEAADAAGQPVHAVLLIDNSLSMAYQQGESTVLDYWKTRARERINNLPDGSRISVIPVCGSAKEKDTAVYSTPEEAIKALDAIEPVDRAASAARVIDLAADACSKVDSPAKKQITFFSDQQQRNWSLEPLAEQLSRLPAKFEVIDPPADQAAPSNAWVSDFQLFRTVADVRAPAEFRATVRYQGDAPRRNVQATLWINGQAVATQTVDLYPGQTRELRYPNCQFSDVSIEPGRVAYVRASVEISKDQDSLPQDNERFLVVPVVASLPVVFIDELGGREDSSKNQFGETWDLRRVLAPITSSGRLEKQLVEVRHLRIEQVTQETLKDARLVVVAGLTKPPADLRLFREYVEQGGNLFLCAGGEFDPAAWSAAWNDGKGILPAPLKAKAVGDIAAVTSGRAEAFQIDQAELVHPYFLVSASPEIVKDLFKRPLFFKAVEAEVSTQAVDKLEKDEAEKIAQNRERLTEIDARLKQLDALSEARRATDADRQEREQLDRERRELSPQWLAWAQSRIEGGAELLPAELARRQRPHVLGRYTNGLPLLVERDLGRGRVTFFTSGTSMRWNSLTTTDTVLLFDRIFRDMLNRTLPVRTLTTTQELALPVDEAKGKLTLIGPDGHEVRLAIGAIAGMGNGVKIGNLSRRGIYRLVKPGPVAPGAKPEEELVAANGPADESELTYIRTAELEQRVQSANLLPIGQGSVMEEDLWNWLILAVMAGLLLELAMLAWPLMARERTA